jgi:hypothetical protein
MFFISSLFHFYKKKITAKIIPIFFFYYHNHTTLPFTYFLFNTTNTSLL